jgi:predicted adenylyl cyclase CyaB
MAILNFEFKAKTARLSELETLLQSFHPRYVGVDEQKDIYFTVPYGRLKLREGNIENALIHYHRTNIAGAKPSHVLLYQHQPDDTLKQLLTAALGIKIIVEKKRKIYFISNVKFHFDEVNGLGTFVEVEAIDNDGSIGIAKLTEQCRHYARLFGIQEEDYIGLSYSDLLLQKMA